MKKRTRCPWCEASELEQQYHDREWGVPQYDERGLFELVTLEGAQAGLSWRTVLQRREAYRTAFCEYDIEAVCRLSEAQLARICEESGVIKHRGKVDSVRNNAQACVALYQESRSLSELLWSFVDGEPRRNAWKTMTQVPTQTKESTAMSKELRRRGFNFVGPTICYALMQAAGLVNDHLVDCYRYSEIA